MAAVPQAVRLALELLHTPALAPAIRRQPLPPDVLALIRIAGGCQDTAREAAATTAESPERIRAATVFYLQQVLLFPGADSYRVLGVSPDAAQDTLHEHMRWLMRWLHPDRTQDEWDSVFAQRVLRAWDDVKSPARRGRYDGARHAGALESEFHPPERGRVREGVARRDFSVSTASQYLVRRMTPSRRAKRADLPLSGGGDEKQHRKRGEAHTRRRNTGLPLIAQPVVPAPGVMRRYWMQTALGLALLVGLALSLMPFVVGQGAP